MAKSVLIVAHTGAFGVELLGVRDLLEMANWCAQEAGEPAPFEVELATHDGAPVVLWGGAELGPVRRLAGLTGEVDTLIVVGGPVAPDATEDPALIAAIGAAGARARRIVGICTGAFLLAEAGLLDGRRATSHWMYEDALAADYPNVQVDTRPVFVVDGHVWTSGAITTGFELVLALIEADVGLPVARTVARRAAMYLRRPGNQTQYREAGGESAIREPLQRVLRTVRENPVGDYSVAALASLALMSERHFLRVFHAEVGTSPKRFVEQERLRVARTLLEADERKVEAVALAAGFGNYQSMRRVFIAELGVTPSEYRERFGGIQEPDQPRSDHR